MFDAFINFLTPVIEPPDCRLGLLQLWCVFTMRCGLWEAQQHTNPTKTPNDGYLGSRNDEERSEMRYAVRIAEFSESSEL